MNCSFDTVALGDHLPPLTIAVTTKLIVSGALASRDYYGVHHDKDFAQSLGSPDIFMNILTSNGLVSRFVTDWAGPDALVRSINIRLGAPNYPGDEMILEGEVIARDEKAGQIEVSVKGNNSLGTHLSAVVMVDLPGALTEEQ